MGRYLQKKTMREAISYDAHIMGDRFVLLYRWGSDLSCLFFQGQGDLYEDDGGKHNGTA